jgi:hypothetical protein
MGRAFLLDMVPYLRAMQVVAAHPLTQLPRNFIGKYRVSMECLPAYLGSNYMCFMPAFCMIFDRRDLFFPFLGTLVF